MIPVPVGVEKNTKSAVVNDKQMNARAEGVSLAKSYCRVQVHSKKFCIVRGVGSLLGLVFEKDLLHNMLK